MAKKKKGNKTDPYIYLENYSLFFMIASKADKLIKKKSDKLKLKLCPEYYEDLIKHLAGRFEKTEFELNSNQKRFIKKSEGNQDESNELTYTHVLCYVIKIPKSKVCLLVNLETEKVYVLPSEKNKTDLRNWISKTKEDIDKQELEFLLDSCLKVYQKDSIYNVNPNPPDESVKTKKKGSESDTTKNNTYHSKEEKPILSPIAQKYLELISKNETASVISEETHQKPEKKSPELHNVSEYLNIFLNCSNEQSMLMLLGLCLSGKWSNWYRKNQYLYDVNIYSKQDPTNLLYHIARLALHSIKDSKSNKKAVRPIDLREIETEPKKWHKWFNKENFKNKIIILNTFPKGLSSKTEQEIIRNFRTNKLHCLLFLVTKNNIQFDHFLSIEIPTLNEEKIRDFKNNIGILGYTIYTYQKYYKDDHLNDKILLNDKSKMIQKATSWTPIHDRQYVLICMQLERYFNFLYKCGGLNEEQKENYLAAVRRLYEIPTKQEQPDSTLDNSALSDLLMTKFSLILEKHREEISTQNTDRVFLYENNKKDLLCFFHEQTPDLLISFLNQYQDLVGSEVQEALKNCDYKDFKNQCNENRLLRHDKDRNTYKISGKSYLAFIVEKTNF